MNRLYGSLGDLDTALRIHDFSNETLMSLADRLERSSVPRHFLLREAELDDLWRYVEAALEHARSDGSEDPRTLSNLERLMGIVMGAHDLAGDGAIKESAQKLRSAMVP